MSGAEVGTSTANVTKMPKEPAVRVKHPEYSFRKKRNNEPTNAGTSTNISGQQREREYVRFY